MRSRRPPVMPVSASRGRRGGGIEGEPAPLQVPPSEVEAVPWEPLLFTVDEAARRLSIARSNVYRHMARGELRSVSIGRCRRIALEDLNEFVRRLRFIAGIV